MAVSRGKVLPALDAAHIKPYSFGGPHEVSNGILRRRDIHSVFDAVTVHRRSARNAEAWVTNHNREIHETAPELLGQSQVSTRPLAQPQQRS